MARGEFPALLADGPATENREALMLFGQFVGEWHFEGRDHLPDGSVSKFLGTIHFAWILEGRAIQDVWHITEQGEARLRPLGTTVRLYDPQLCKWTIAWLSPLQNAVKILSGGQVGDAIVLEGKSADEIPLRWIFSRIAPDSFHWRGEKLRGDAWGIAEELVARRVGARNGV